MISRIIIKRSYPINYLTTFRNTGIYLFQSKNHFVRNFTRITAMSSSSSSSNNHWNSNLTSEQLHVLRDKGTERPHTGKYLHNKDSGVYTCANCSNPLYTSNTKFDSGCGWPSFYKPYGNKSLNYHVDNSMGVERIEITCKKCGGHLGHVFKGEGWTKLLNLPVDERHCVNSASLNFSKID
ncbi:peptide-methionine (R)-S-oxide reductase NDAI_0A00420 [Naumovozyma dairenensis CBS 421]|uniref:Peptide-methionine (R)-S-oxide reductase n=1 Tax=Naumovozyma dairenensis (strain ATCC 10597 / BCRC 20456 / CBS 421 / NBRC 0211 / NRRL Y-12639) TaxID=1071378 RepID=G0W312_NAUDC|nr:hypothetical protein NDAI_0A00420 [Naumovozyma dairenensis CBS 421]CCD22200.1 hypothetical protein NDAI_0A00420 [Naumovozyma dairenensis CBS 421]